MARLRDVAERAGVSLSVASRVLNNVEGARINTETRARVLSAATALKYVADHRARALRLSRAGAIALIVPEANNAIFASLHAGVQEACQASNTAVFLAELDAPQDTHGQLTRLIGNGRVDGVILQRSALYDDDALRKLIEIDVPVVLFNSVIEEHSGSISMDDREGVFVALRHLVALGHHQIGFLEGPAQHDAARRRKDAFFAFMASAGLTVHDEWVQPGGWEASDGAESMRRLLEARALPTAVLAASLNSAVGAISTARASGVQVPEDISLMGIHDAWLARYMTPALSTVELPMHTAGRAAGVMLLDHLEGSPLENIVVSVPVPKLLARSSTGAPRAASA